MQQKGVQTDYGLPRCNHSKVKIPFEAKDQYCLILMKLLLCLSDNHSTYGVYSLLHIIMHHTTTPYCTIWGMPSFTTFTNPCKVTPFSYIKTAPLKFLPEIEARKLH